MTRTFGCSLKLIACVPVALSALAQAAPTCIPLAGFVRLDPEPPGTCTIAVRYSGYAYIGAPDTCFSVKIRGPFGFAVIGTGSSGLTFETVGGFAGGVTPASLNEFGVPVFTDGLGTQTRRFFSARSAIDMFGGTLFTADAGVLSGAGVSEQLLVTGGTGPWVGATGAIYPRGNIIQQWGAFNGQVCKP
jgi:hypothetical protein